MDVGKGRRSIYEDEELVINVRITWIQLGMFHNRISAPLTSLACRMIRNSAMALCEYIHKKQLASMGEVLPV